MQIKRNNEVGLLQWHSQPRKKNHCRNYLVVGEREDSHTVLPTAVSIPNANTTMESRSDKVRLRCTNWWAEVSSFFLQDKVISHCIVISLYLIILCLPLREKIYGCYWKPKKGDSTANIGYSFKCNLFSFSNILLLECINNELPLYNRHTIQYYL